MAGLFSRLLLKSHEDRAYRILLKNTRKAIDLARQGVASKVYNPSSSDIVGGTVHGRVQSYRDDQYMGVEVVYYGSDAPLRRIWDLLQSEGGYASTRSRAIDVGLSSPPPYVLDFSVPTS